MLTLGKLLGATAVNGVIHSTQLFQRFLSGMVIIIVLAVISSIMLASLIVGGIFAVYTSLIDAGVESMPAIMVIVGLLAFITALLFGITLWQMKQLKEGVTAAISPKSSGGTGGGFGRVIDAFLEGFSRKPV